MVKRILTLGEKIFLSSMGIPSDVDTGKLREMGNAPLTHVPELARSGPGCVPKTAPAAKEAGLPTREIFQKPTVPDKLWYLSGQCPCHKIFF